MRLHLVYKIVAPVLLAVFTITSCNVFVMPQPKTISVPVGKGDIRFVYLNENYGPTTNDIGKTAMYVENNELTKNILILAEIPENNIDNDVVVRVLNKENRSLVSFFYNRGQYFPGKMVITVDGEEIIGRFSLFNIPTETYSVEFSNEEGESQGFQDFVLNKNVFSLHENDDALTDTQNLRICHIITTLALWNSLAFQIDDNFEVGGRAINWKSFFKIVTAVLAVVAVVAVAVVVILAVPAAIAVSGTALTVSLATTTQAAAGLVAVAAGASAVVSGILSDVLDEPEEHFSGNQSPPPPNEDRRPMIEITLNNVRVENNGMPPYYLDMTESLTFDLKITNLASYAPYDIIDIANLINWFEPQDKKFININGNLYNAFFFDYNATEDINNVIRITVTRNEKSGYVYDGKVQLVLKFHRDVIINEKGSGINFWTDTNEQIKGRKDIFVLNFTVLDS